MCLSVPQMAAAATRIRISSGAGFGTGQSRISVPAVPSAGADLTTACIEKTARMLSQRYRHDGFAAQRSANLAERRIEESLRLLRRLERNVSRVPRQIDGEAVDRPHHRVAVTSPEVLVETAVDDLDLLRRRARVEELVGH